MPNPSTTVPANRAMEMLSQLLLARFPEQENAAQIDSSDVWGDGAIRREDFDEIVALASTNHVIMRVLRILTARLRATGDLVCAAWAEEALEKEHARIRNAMAHLRAICSALVEEGHDVTVIKSLDHWPDLGSDLDLYTNAESAAIIGLMGRRLQARLAPRSWGDRLARKWNFLIPGLPEAVEVHVGRLGQTGEQCTLAAGVPGRARMVEIDGESFRVPSPSDRLMISTLQRMYRHFYFRLCDIVDSAQLVESGSIDYGDLRDSAERAGIWEGVATYLAIVSDYVERYRGSGLDLPLVVRADARFGGERIRFARAFLRVPILPESAGLYGTQLAGLLRRREVRSSARLSLLPWLAVAASAGQKITGSDKGIW